MKNIYVKMICCHQVRLCLVSFTMSLGLPTTDKSQCSSALGPRQISSRAISDMVLYYTQRIINGPLDGARLSARCAQSPPPRAVATLATSQEQYTYNLHIPATSGR